jgi:hypothetical protein
VEGLESPHDPDRPEDLLSYTKLHLWNLTDYRTVRGRNPFDQWSNRHV